MRKTEKDQNNRNNIRKAVVALLALVLMVTAFAGCGNGAENPGSAPAPTPPAAPAPEPAPQPEPYYWPLTGIEYGKALPGQQDSFKYPLSVKIENTPEARPQLGIARADVVYESVTEGGITRFNCMFQSDIPDLVGPVRSARNSDITIVPEYNAILYFSGTNSDVWASLGASTIKNMPADIDSKSKFGQYYYLRKSTRPPENNQAIFSPHNLYLNLGGCYQWSMDYWGPKGWTDIDTNPSTLDFGDLDPSMTTTDVTSVYMPFSEGTFNPTWTWDASTNTFLRTVDGKPFMDADPASGQVKANNVVVLWAPEVNGPFIENKGYPLHIDMTGTNRAMVFRDGKMIEGTWVTDGTTPPRFYDANGKEILLTPGKTWMQVLNSNSNQEPTITGPGGTVDQGTGASGDSSSINTAQSDAFG
ncbi:MAG: DUF3048 domain-containing protein [Clostridiales bacterium]|nr:DUF3048 domain-containing protein [Clostridiales bacterium]